MLCWRFGDLDAVGEGDALDDFGQCCSPLSRLQVFTAAVTSLNTINQVRRPQVIPVLGGGSRRRSAARRGPSPGRSPPRRIWRPTCWQTSQSPLRGPPPSRSRQVGLGRGLDGLGQLVEHVDRLAQCSADAGSSATPRRAPSRSRGSVSGRRLRRNGQATRLEVDLQPPPALRAFPYAHLEAEQFLPALRRGADQYQHALGLRLHSGLQVNTVAPDVDVAMGGQVARLSMGIVGLPLATEAGSDGWRHFGRPFPARLTVPP